MMQGLVTYRRSARSLYRFLGAGPHTMFMPGDFVCHRLCEDSFGLLVSKVSNDHMTVMWMNAPDMTQQQLDMARDL